MNETIKIACPACEYERNTAGKPVEKNGQMECLECGSKWRVFGNLNPPGENSLPEEKNQTRTQVLSEQVTFRSYEEAGNKQASKIRPSYKPGLGSALSLFAAATLFIGFFVGLNFLKNETRSIQSNQLSIAEVNIKEKVRRNGEKVFTVEGLITNPTASDKPIPKVSIILRQKNGNEIFRWQYTSSLPSLSAGGKSRFASSIQYDTPIVAYAEAVFIK